ncbi:TlpA family protein disulfide reductase [Schlesneria paludicola]|uniref:TlpA family protein disulfide reductase n=1 Tax=Schlesneria paludicola TaxID=360056 RepID=UPI00029B1660|nr:TlpA disulfide reductase family protein [Schlesneria paludicola]
MIFTRFLSIAVVSLGVPLMSAGAAASAESPSNSLPEYRFEVGQEFVYFGSSEMTYDGGTFQTLSRSQFFVIAQNSDGTWELLVRNARLFEQIRKNEDLAKAKAKMKKTLEKSDDQSVVRTFGRFRIDRHGRMHGLPAMAEVYAKVSHILVGLPQSWEEAEHGWTVVDTSLGESLVSRRSESNVVTETVIKTLVQSSQNAVFEIEEDFTTTFDVESRLPRQIMAKTVQNYAPKGESTTTVELVGVKKHPIEWATMCAEETAKCDDVIQQHGKILEERNLDPAQLNEQLQQSRETLERLANRLKTDELKAAMLDQVVKWKQEQEHEVQSTTERAAMIGTKSISWKTTDLDGNEISVADFQGKVVVMDFWYRGCGWCIVAMPQVKEIAEHFRDQPVAVLGMNTDERLENAKFVIEKLDLKYPNLKAEAIAEEYKLQGFPSLLILDQKGTIRDVHIGYSQTLKDNVIRSVEKLLNAPP